MRSLMKHRKSHSAELATAWSRPCERSVRSINVLFPEAPNCCGALEAAESLGHSELLSERRLGLCLNFHVSYASSNVAAHASISWVLESFGSTLAFHSLA